MKGRAHYSNCCTCIVLPYDGRRRTSDHISAGNMALGGTAACFVPWEQSSAGQDAHGKPVTQKRTLTGTRIWGRQVSLP